MIKPPRFGNWPTTQLTWAHGMLWFAATGVGHVVLGRDISVEWAALVAASMGIATAQFIGKRATQFRPEEHARAEQIKNGNDVERRD